MPELRVLVPRLPATARARLRFEWHVDRLGAWLCGHHCTWAAVWLWRACRMW